MRAWLVIVHSSYYETDHTNYTQCMKLTLQNLSLDSKHSASLTLSIQYRQSVLEEIVNNIDIHFLKRDIEYFIELKFINGY